MMWLRCESHHFFLQYIFVTINGLRLMDLLI
nr:MAG TPA: hypothetical protein [Caudoviricetes sp.]